MKLIEVNTTTQTPRIIVEQTEMERKILQHSIIHFGQVKNTPLLNEPNKSIIGNRLDSKLYKIIHE